MDQQPKMSEETEIKLLTMHYIQGKEAGSALDFVNLYRQTQVEIRDAYNATKGLFNLEPLL